MTEMRTKDAGRWAATLGVAAVLLATAATCGGDDAPVELNSWEVTAAEIGDEMEIRLSAEPGIGDAWQVAEPPDEAVARVVDQTSESDEPDVAGGSWEDIVILEAVGPGTATVVMHNCFRCDDDGNTPAEYAEEAVDISFTIKVE
jgi:hypothetical protein